MLNKEGKEIVKGLGKSKFEKKNQFLDYPQIFFSSPYFYKIHTDFYAHFDLTFIFQGMKMNKYKKIFEKNDQN